MHINAKKERAIIHVLHCFYCDFISASVCYIAADSHVAMTTIYAPLRASLCSVKAGIQRAELQSGGWGAGRGRSQMRRRRIPTCPKTHFQIRPR